MIYFLSDSHIGSRALPDIKGHERRCIEMLTDFGRDATAIYLLGDIFDFRYEYLWHQKELYQDYLNTLKGLVDKGVKVHYFTGNHDLWLFGKLERKTGVTVHKEPLATTIAGKRCYLAHGDGIGPSDLMEHYPPEIQKKIRRFMRLRSVFHNRFCQTLFRLLPPAWGDSFGYEWARKSRLKELAHPIGYKGEGQEELVLFAKEEEGRQHFDYYIFGHRHIELDLQLVSSARVIVLGDTFKQWTYAQMTEEGELTLKNYE